MLDIVVFEEYWRNIKVSAYTDLYAYDPEDGALLFISLAGNEQAVKAISSAIIACKTVTVTREGQPEQLLNGHPASRYRIMSTKLSGGSLHQIVADARFYVNSDADSRLVIIPTDMHLHEAIYSQVLAPLASPVIPTWAQWVCDRLQQVDRLREMAGTLRVMEVAVDDHVVDEIISEGVRIGQIHFNEEGGAYAGWIIAFAPQFYYKRPPSRMGGGEVMQQEPLNLVEFQRKFATEEACVEHLFKLRWPGGYHCPRCGHGSYCFHSTRRLYQCSKCKYQVSVTAGTIFHKTRTPLVSWFWMIFMMARQRSGLSMMSCQRMLGIKTYKTVWTMGHKIRKAMADRDSQYQLAGLVEMDDAFIGLKKPGPPGRGANGKAKVVIAVESRDKHAGFAVMRHVPAVDGDQILSVAQYTIQAASGVRTDGWRAYQTLGSNGFVHEFVIVSKDKEALKQLKWVHVLTANIKGNIRGVYHGVSEKHLGRYLAEFSYRFNRRKWDSQLFNRTVAACVSTSTVTFAELRA